MPEALLLRSVAVHGDIDAGAVWGRGQLEAVEVVPACYGGLGVCNQVGDSRWADGRFYVGQNRKDREVLDSQLPTENWPLLPGGFARSLYAGHGPFQQSQPAAGKR